MAKLDIKTLLFSRHRRSDAAHLFWSACALAFVAGMVMFPRLVFEGAVTGLNTWWNIVFPALLPFFIASELLMNFGVVHFMGVLMEPVMRPLFNVPGAGSFVVAVGFTSGYPIGSMVTAKLRSKGLCTRVEAERLMSFTNNSSPLFMLVAVAVGMFNLPGLGVIIAGAHYLSNLTLGLLLRFYARNNRERVAGVSIVGGNPLTLAFRRMLEVQRQENRPLGKIIGDAVRNAVTSLLNIGGFIILFAVIIRLLTAVGFIDHLARCLGILLLPLGFSPELLPALSSGLFEMTIGTKMVSETAAPLAQQLTAVGMILAWSGLSIHAQTASMISETDIRMLPFIVSRIVHTCLGGLYTYIIYTWAGMTGKIAATAAAFPVKWNGCWSLIPLNLKFFGIFLLLLLLFTGTGIFLNLAKRPRIKLK
jgi:sporulation integral membrane protein YlbJ